MSGAPLSTQGIGINQNGTVVVSAGASWGVIEQGSSVTYGPPETIAEGSPLPEGVWEIQSGGTGTLEATGGTVIVVPVTITAP